MRPLDEAQARTLLEALRGNRLEALYTVALALGLRKGEALGLKWSDVDLDEGTISVRRALYCAGGKLRLTDVKTRKSRRTGVAIGRHASSDAASQALGGRT